MPVPENLVRLTQQTILKLFMVNKFVRVANLYKIKVTNNLYRDKISRETEETFITLCHVSFNTPLKVAKQLDWWKEGDPLPILCFFPAGEYNPKKDDIIKVLQRTTSDTFQDGFYEINNVKQYGPSAPVVWLVSLSPYRE